MSQIIFRLVVRVTVAKMHRMADNTSNWLHQITHDTTRNIADNITATGGGGDMTVDNTSIAFGQTVNITGFTKTMGGA